MVAAGGEDAALRMEEGEIIDPLALRERWPELGPELQADSDVVCYRLKRADYVQSLLQPQSLKTQFLESLNEAI